MEKHFFFLVLLIINLTFICEIKAQDDWFWQNPLPQGNTLKDVKFISVTIGWAVGESGTILRTIDGGTNWTSQSSGTTNYLNSVSFTDANNGIAVGDGGTILRTIGVVQPCINGSIIYNTTTGKFNFCEDGVWVTK